MLGWGAGLAAAVGGSVPPGAAHHWHSLMLQQSKQRAAVVRWEASRSGARARRASSAAAQRRRWMRRGEEVKPREEEVKPRSSPSPFAGSCQRPRRCRGLPPRAVYSLLLFVYYIKIVESSVIFRYIELAVSRKKNIKRLLYEIKSAAQEPVFKLRYFSTTPTLGFTFSNVSHHWIPWCTASADCKRHATQVPNTERCCE